MKFVVPLRRMAGPDLVKSFTRGEQAASHKYLRRQRAWVNGRMSWRYFYADDEQRKRAVAQHDPNLKHEHKLLSDLKELHPNLKSKALGAAEATMEFIKGLFGYGGKPVDVKVSATPRWTEKYHEPHVAQETVATDDAGRRSPQARVAKGLELISDNLKQLVSKSHEREGAKSSGITKFVLTDIEDEDGALKSCAGWYRPSTGETHITSEALGSTIGEARFRSPLTWTEEVVIHEFGHAVHHSLEVVQPTVWASWVALSPGGNKISNYANTNVKEDFAETFACAHSHPKQLARECPERYEWMRKHVVPELRPLNEMLNTPDEDLMWWVAKPNTPATKVLNRARHDFPATRHAGYYSDKDQFYIVNKDGRQVYLRVGPEDKQSEDGWERIPATVDPQTGLPRYEGGLYNRFRAESTVKEIYDEHGNPLDDRQAYFYLGQDDQRVIDLVSKLDESGEPDKAVEALYDPKKWSAQRGSLGRQIFDSLGGNKFDPGNLTEDEAKDPANRHKIGGTLEYERKRVERERAKGNTGVLDRHEWVPVEISPREFMDKSGTFKFGDVREAPDAKQTHQLRDSSSGKVLTYYDPVRGESRPQLGSRLYEQQNPDGTWTKMRVHEESGFNRGENILAPQKFVRVVADDQGDGETRYLTYTEAMWAVEKGRYVGRETHRFTQWVKYKLGDNDPTDPDALARQFGTTARTMLETNRRYGRGQIMDPVLAELLNPGGRKQIRSAADLQALMREAANSVPPRRAWVSIAGKSEHGVGRAVGHIQVEWDGAGPPKVVGDYWARRLGKTQVRLDELLNKSDEIRLPRIVEHKSLGAKKAAIGPNSVVWIKDPKTGKRIMATFVNKVDNPEGGAPLYKVQPIAGQGSGIEKKVITVDSVQPRLMSEIPNVGKIGKVRRFVDRLDHDVLLYADEVPVGSGGNDPNGVVRILLPADGSISFEEIRGMPGVQDAVALDPDQKGQGQTILGIAVSDIPKFRRKIGGFVMDNRVRAMLDQAMQQERAVKERLDGEEAVGDADIVDERGNIAADGVLKGLVVGDEGIQPGVHRIKGLKKLAKNGGRLMAAHFMGTGKTAFAIMASQMMRNLKDKDGNPHPQQTKGKTLIVVPLNTAENWYQEFKRFAGAPPTLVGASTLAGAQQLPKLPERGERENDATYKKRVLSFWSEHVKEHPSTWNPETDSNPNMVIPYEYFREHEEALRITGLFDGMVVDEAHKIANENEVSRAIERWNNNMKLFLPMTGTPITNTLSTLPRIIRLVSGGQVDLGDDKSFTETYLVESAVQRAMGAKNPPRTDLNPNKVGELMSKIQPYIDVANTTDVKGQNMPAVLLDENSPAHMVGQQATMYRAAMAQMTDADRAALEGSSALGLDEEKMLSESARRKVAVARSTANCPAYKAPDLREELQYEATIATPNEKRGTIETTTQKRAFRLPDYDLLMSNKQDGWNKRWPDTKDVRAGRIHEGYLDALMKYSYSLFGVTYDALQGKKVSPEIIASIKKNDYTTPTGLAWNAKIANPDYGPEGMVSRGVANAATGEIDPIRYRWTDDQGHDHEDVVPTGAMFVRDPNRKAAGLFYHSDDWDFTGRFEDTGEGGKDDDSDAGVIAGLKDEGWIDHPEDKGLILNPESGLTRDKPKGWASKASRNQAPKAGRESLSVQRSVERRKERAMFDAVVTTGNAKADAMEEWIKNVANNTTGDPRADLTQFIHFGNRVGSSVRTMEAKLRTMGFQDVNEALGHADVSGPADRAIRPRKYFVTYMGKGATLGDRNLNSEIFRRKQDKYGKDMGVSMFVWRTLYGGTGKPPGLHEIREGWSANERKSIEDNFRDDSGRLRKDGTPAGLEVPMRVLGADGPNGTIVQKYAYDSDLRPKDRARIKQLEVLIRGSSGTQQKAHEQALKDILAPYWTDRNPLSDRQQHVFNNTQHMVASDAANVGLNWPAAYLGMYDSLFSPMDEWQRITRAARMLPPAVSREAAPIVAQIDEWIRKNEVDTMKGIKDYDSQSAMGVINAAIDALPEGDRAKLKAMPEGSADMLIEAYFAKRSLERIQGLREAAENKLRREGYWPDPERRDAMRLRIAASSDPDEQKRLSKELVGLFVPPAAIQGSDVTNYILREDLSPFERKMMRDRRFLVHVKRFTTSVDMPEMERVAVTTDIGNGKVKRKMVEVPTGEFVVESPSQAERSQLAQQRAKMVPYERFLNDVQNAVPQTTDFDFLSSHASSMATTSTTDHGAQAMARAYVDEESLPYAQDLLPPAPEPVAVAEVEDASQGSLHERIAKKLGWSVAETQSFALRSLREMVRQYPKLVAEIDSLEQSGRVVVGAPYKKSSKPVLFARLPGRS